MSFEHTAAEILELSDRLQALDLPDEADTLKELLARRMALLEKLSAEFGALSAAESKVAAPVVEKLRADAASLEELYRSGLTQAGNQIQVNKRRQNLEDGLSNPQCVDRKA